MRRYGIFCALLISLLGCSDEDDVLRLQLNGLSQSWVPDFSEPQEYASANGDTIELSLERDRSYTETMRAGMSNTSGRPTIGTIELEKREVVIKAGLPDVFFFINLRTEHNEQSPSLSEDFFEFYLEDHLGQSMKLQFEVGDSMRCITPDCHYRDTATVASRSYPNVFFSPLHNPRPRALYLSRSRGIVGFKVSGGELYELID